MLCIENSSSNRDRWLEFVNFLLSLSSLSSSVPLFVRSPSFCVPLRRFFGMLFVCPTENLYGTTSWISTSPKQQQEEKKKLCFVWSFRCASCLMRKVSKHNERKPLHTHTRNLFKLKFASMIFVLNNFYTVFAVSEWLVLFSLLFSTCSILL